MPGSEGASAFFYASQPKRHWQGLLSERNRFREDLYAQFQLPAAKRAPKRPASASNEEGTPIGWRHGPGVACAA